jgi:hypothetical protein
LETQSGEILGETARRHTSVEFVGFLEEIVASQPKGKGIHVIADNLLDTLLRWASRAFHTI